MTDNYKENKEYIRESLQYPKRMGITEKRGYSLFPVWKLCVGQEVEGGYRYAAWFNDGHLYEWTGEHDIPYYCDYPENPDEWHRVF